MHTLDSQFSSLLRANPFVLAPLTKGGNVPFRRLCTHFGAVITCSEMVMARNLLKNIRREGVLLRRHPEEKIFGVQLACNQVAEAVEAAKIVEGSGASFLDINCGCPIHEFTRRGLGSSLLRRPNHIGRLVEGLCSAVAIPVTVKIRIGWGERENNAVKIASIAQDAGASAVTVHGRTRDQRYSRKADWTAIREVKEALTIPVIGNGDIYSQAEAHFYLKNGYADAVMLARGALIKPWLFAELLDCRNLNKNVSERVAFLALFARYLCEYFGDDEKGKERAERFLSWHLDFFARYRPVEDSDFDVDAEIPIIHRRSENHERVSAVEKLLSSNCEEHWQQIANYVIKWRDDVVALEQALLDLADTVSVSTTDIQASSVDVASHG